MAQRTPITIRLDRFEGPLDLLLYLIQSHELDISKISIGKITEQYVTYVRFMQELNFDIASDFLVMAATLIQWKSKALLPVEETTKDAQAAEDDIITPEELLRQLMDHQRFLEAGRELAALPHLGLDVFRRPNLRAPTEKVWKTMETTQLALTYQDLLIRERRSKQLLKKETVSLSTKIMDFADRLAIGKIIGMSSLIRDIQSRPERVVTFLASLELARLRKMKVYQEGTYEEIYVELLESLKGFDTKMASGFDELTANIDAEIKAGTTSASADFAPGADHVAGHAAAEFHAAASQDEGVSHDTIPGHSERVAAADSAAAISADLGSDPEIRSADAGGVDERLADSTRTDFDLHAFEGSTATAGSPETEQGTPPADLSTRGEADELDPGRTHHSHE